MCAHSKDFAFEVLLKVRGAALVNGEGGRELLEPHGDVQKEGGNFLMLLVAPVIDCRDNVLTYVRGLSWLVEWCLSGQTAETGNINK